MNKAKIRELYEKKVNVHVVPSRYNSFPHPETYEGQNEAIETIMTEDICLFSSHTGSGKTPVFLTAAHELEMPTLVLEPRKFLQKQVSEYFGDCVIYGKSEYPCKYAKTAADAPCKRKFKSKRLGTMCFLERDFGSEVNFRGCAARCEYFQAKSTAMDALRSSGIVIANFGNFWAYIKKAEFIVIDESDEFFRAVSSGMMLFQSEHVEDIRTMIPLEERALADEREKIDIKLENTDMAIDRKTAKRLDSIENVLQRLRFFSANHDICFAYEKKTAKKVYIEVMPDKTMMLMDRLFRGKKVCIVTATPSQFIGGA